MRSCYLTAAAVVAFCIGCNKSPEGGTPNTDASFKISLPAVSQDVKKGDTRTVDGTVERGSAFKKDVKLKVESMEKKLDVSLSKETVKAEEKDGKFGIVLKPADDAPLGEYEVKVTATPDGGGTATSQTFKVKVTDK